MKHENGRVVVNPAEPDSVGKAAARQNLGESGEQAGTPWMPHNDLDSGELDIRYPSLEAIDDVDMPDLSRLEDESLYSAGMKVVQNILREMSEVGRTRSSPVIDNDTVEHNEAKDAPQAKSKWRSVGVVVGEDRSGFGPGGGRSGWTVDASGVGRYRCAPYLIVHAINMDMSMIVRRSCVVIFMHHTFLPGTVCTVPPL